MVKAWNDFIVFSLVSSDILMTNVPSIRSSFVYPQSDAPVGYFILKENIRQCYESDYTAKAVDPYLAMKITFIAQYA